ILIGLDAQPARRPKEAPELTPKK
ncbi:MAG: hypothetical protein RLZZ149_1042, partial [Pseudomonadota bacterium]